MSQALDNIRETVRLHKGVRISYRAANGRRKVEERNGVIQEVYPRLFTVYIDSQQSTVSFSYADILTRDVEVQLESSGENLF